MRADLHIHTFHSKDNHQTIQEIIEAAREKDLRAIAITDHNTTEGASAVMEAAPEWLIVLPGIEITSEDGHILALNIQQNIPKGLSVQETIVRIHDAGGIAVAAHPYRKWTGLKESSVRQGSFDAIEAINGRNTRKSNRHALDLAMEIGMPMVAGSDAHKQSKIGTAITVFPDSVRTRDEMIHAIMNKQVQVEGSGRPRKETLTYGSGSIAKWMRRGMRRL